MAVDQATQPDLGRSALRKVSWRLLPLIALGYGVAYIDRSNISFAALQMNQDLRFSAAVYGLGAGLFFLSYALFEVPSNLLLLRFGARRWISRIMLTWGLLAVAMMFVRTPLQFYAARFLLGLAEAGFFPGVVFYLAQWFPAAQRGRAISRFYVAVPLSAVVMGAVAGSLLGLDGAHGLRGWQWLFLVEGVPAILLSAAVFLLLPDKPADAPWLTEAEKAWIGAPTASEVAFHGGPAHRSVLSCLLDPVVLQFSAVNFLLLGSYYAFTLSAPALLKGATGLDAARIGWLTSGAGLVGALCMVLNAWSSDRFKERYFHLVAPALAMTAALAVMGATRSPVLVSAAYVAAIGAFMAAAPVVWPPISESIHPAAAAASFAAINCVGQVGSFVSTSLWGVMRDRTGGYALGLHVLPLMCLLAALLLLVLRQQHLQRVRARPALAVAIS